MNPVELYLAAEEAEEERRAQFREAKRALRLNLDIPSLPDQEFQRIFRLSKELYENLRNEIGPFMLHEQRTSKLSLDTRILAALRFFACGSYQKGIGEEHVIAISQPSMSRCIQEVATALQRIAPRWVNFPINNEQKQAAKLGFMQKFNFPGVVGVIDATHIALLKPVEDEHIYINRKGFHSKNVQIICDSDLIITNVNGNYGGATHDSFIWRNSLAYTHMEQNYLRGDRTSWLLGDSGYPQQPWLMTPFRDTVANTPHRRYDDRLSLARNCIERCIGVLKMRFRCLAKERVLRYEPNKSGVIINACVVLHNMCIRGNIPIEEHPEPEPHELRAVDNDIFAPYIMQEGMRQRDHILHMYFQE